jgi:ketosteroid isomerase-like protein
MYNNNDNQTTLERFYSAFTARDGVSMSACYDDMATFRDPVFDLRGEDVGAMWRMLCSRGKDLRVVAANLSVDGDHGSADWQAWYSFSATGRQVHNRVNSRFRFVEGRIIEQLDSFSFWAWSRQALGPAGLLLGWSPFLQNKVAVNARASLAQFRAGEVSHP